jgi:NAD(P)-dependent dehydrogenase (short-subunit alcohol dehydrogenase family)
MSTLSGKVAVITGGNSGIGLSTAKELKSQGASIAIFGRDAQTLESAQKDLGGDTLAVQGDVSSVADIEKLFSEVKGNFGKVDILFVNAGVVQLAPIDAVSEEEFDRQVGINYKGAFFTVQKALPLMTEGSSVILNSTVMADLAWANSSLYASSKAALTSLGRIFATELAPRGIRVNTVSPGPISTPIYGRMGMEAKQLEGFAEQVRGQVPLKRFGDAQEIAKTVSFLASADAAFITGQNLAVDGGIGL